MGQHFAETRLRLVARLAALLRQYAEDFNTLGHVMTQRAFFTMVVDCRVAGVDRAAIGAALAGGADSGPPPGDHHGDASLGELVQQWFAVA